MSCSSTSVDQYSLVGKLCSRGQNTLIWSTSPGKEYQKVSNKTAVILERMEACVIYINSIDVVWD